MEESTDVPIEEINNIPPPEYSVTEFDAEEHKATPLSSDQSIQLASESVSAIQTDVRKQLGKLTRDLVHGDTIVSAVDQNISKQIQTLLQAIPTIEHGSTTTINFFGRSLTISNMAEIKSYIEKIRDDLTVLQNKIATEVELGEVINQIDKYLFDGKNFELIQGMPLQVQVFDSLKSPTSDIEHAPFIQTLLKESIIPPTDEVKKDREHPHRQLPAHTRYSQLPHLPHPGIEKARHGYEDMSLGQYYTDIYIDKHRIFKSPEALPDVVVVNIKDKEEMNYAHYTYQQLLIEAKHKPLDKSKEPILIFFTDGFTPQLDQIHTYQGALFASSVEDLRSNMNLAREVISARKKPEFMGASVLAASQEELYDNSDLREWEAETADTYQSLKHVLQVIREREALAELSDKLVLPRLLSGRDDVAQFELSDRERKAITMSGKEWRPRTILDCGTGEGRIAGMLARLGYYVMGLDISSEQLARVPKRIEEEGAVLRGEASNPLLSANALMRLQAEGALPPEAHIDLDDEEVKKRYATVKGNFLSLHADLHRAVLNWENQYPNTDKYDFFNVKNSEYSYAFHDQGDQFTDVGFDMVLFNWHTFCEAGTPDEQLKVLENALNVMNPGGTLVIEIPDRMVGSYAESLKNYHELHPDEPFGTIRDSTSTDPGVATMMHEEATEDTPRYFPDRNELVYLLKAAGFEIDPEKDIQTYLITKEDPATGKKTLQVKELFITARKPSVI